MGEDFFGLTGFLCAVAPPFSSYGVTVIGLVYAVCAFVCVYFKEYTLIPWGSSNQCYF